MNVLVKRGIKFAALALIVAAVASFFIGGKAVSGENKEIPVPPKKMVMETEGPATGDAWEVRCNSKDGKPVEGGCEVFQKLSVKKTGERVVEFAVGYPKGKDGSARGVIILPLGILLTEDIQMQVDDQQKVKFRVRYCTSKGCFAYLDLNRQTIDLLRNGQKTSITAKDLNGRDVNIIMSMSGFAKKLSEVEG